MRKRSTITHPVAGILPEELMMEIIVRIPVRFLGRLRCVCKSWNALITDPQFALELIDHNKNTQQKILFPCFSPHARNSAKPYDRKYVALFRLNEQPRILYDLNLSPCQKLDFPYNLNFPDSFKECIVAGSINGIVCLASLCRPGTRFVALWNPSIKYWKPIHLPDTGDCNWFESIGLAFDSLANDYKVIRLLPLLRQMTSSSSSISRVEVYSASQDSWSVVHSEIPFFTTQLKCSLIVKGVPYWSRNYHSSYCVYDNFQSNVIASFDPRTGLYKKISYPQILLNEKTSVHPFNLMDSLAILMYSPGEKPNQTFHVYALDDENSCATTWINLCSTPAPTVQLNKDLRILRCFEDPAGKTIVVGWNPHQSDFFLYDLKTDCLIESIGLDAYRTSRPPNLFPGDQTFDVYALDVENSCATTWTNIYTTATPTILQKKDISIVQCFEDAGKTVVVGRYYHLPKDDFLYDLKSDNLIDSIGLKAFHPRWDELYHHVESLVYIPGMKPIQTEDE
ncbi:hypothetical protein AgCh_019416 [Apium graveolens]